MVESQAVPLRFTGHAALRQRLVLATLTGRPVRISQIRPSSPINPGLAEHEVSFLRLLEAVTNGSVIEISYTGTTLLYRPGLITGSGGSRGLGGGGGGLIHHEIPAGCTRGLSYFLLPLCLLAPFSKTPVNVLFTGPGVTTSATPPGAGGDGGDMSVDSVRTAVLPLYAHFGILPSSIELRILRRGSLSSAAADGGGGGGGGRLSGGNGEVRLSFTHQVRLPKTLHLLNRGRVKRVRGVAYCIGVSASNNARMIEAARGVLNPLLSDVYIFSDVSSAPPAAAAAAAAATGAGGGGGGGGGARRRIGIGFGLSLVAESSTGALYSADMPSEPQGGQLPEDLGRRCAHKLLETIAQGGCVPLAAAPTVLILMAMGSEDLGRVVLGRDVVATPEVVGLARDLKAFGANGWGIREAEGSYTRNGGNDNRADNEGEGEEEEDEDEEGDEGGNGDVIVSIIGRGIGNVGKKIS